MGKKDEYLNQWKLEETKRRWISIFHGSNSKQFDICGSIRNKDNLSYEQAKTIILKFAKIKERDFDTITDVLRSMKKEVEKWQRKNKYRM